MKTFTTLIALALVLFCLPAQADEALSVAVRGQASDAATTLVGTAIEGVKEANPLGVAGVVLLKPLAVLAIDRMDEPDRTEGLTMLGAMGTGAAVNNLCVFGAVLLELAAQGMSGGSITALCLAAGVYAGMQDWQQTEPLRLEAAAGARRIDTPAQDTQPIQQATTTPPDQHGTRPATP